MSVYVIIGSGDDGGGDSVIRRGVCVDDHEGGGWMW